MSIIQVFTRNAWAAYGQGVPAGTLLFDVAQGSFVRPTSSATSTLASASTIQYWPADTLRYENRGDGFGSLPLFEGNRTQWVKSSENLGSGPWATNFATYTPNNVISPDGTMNAGTLAYNATASATLRAQCPDPTPPSNVTVTMSWWYHEGTGTKASPVYFIDKSNAFQGGVVSVGTSVWQQGNFTAPSGAGTQALTLDFHNNPGGTAHQFVPWGVQLETGNFPSSYISNPSTLSFVNRSADVLQYMPSQVPFHVRARKWTQKVYPYWSNTDPSASDEFWLYSFSRSDGLRFKKNGSNVRLEALRSGSIVAASGTLTFARQAQLTLIVDPVVGQLSVNGVGGSVGTPWVWPAGTPVRQGGVMNLSSEFFGRMGPMTALS